MIPNALAKPLYVAQTKMRGENVDRHLRDLLKTQWLSRGDLADLQWRKLSRLLHHAYRNSPYYRRTFDEHGVSPDKIRQPQDLKRLPLLDKENLRRHFQAMKVSGGSYKYSVAKSSGSTGQSVKFWKDHNASGSGRAAMFRGHSWYGVEVGAREAMLWGVPLNLKGRLMCRWQDFALNRFREENFQLTDAVLSSFYDRMKRVRPVYLMGYSSLVYELAHHLWKHGIEGSSLQLRMVKVTAESLPDYQRNLIEEVFSCPVVSEYGAAEVGVIAFECPQHELHITAEGVLLEELESPVRGVGSELVITDLDNYYAPIIRYRLGDYARCSSAICACGRGLPLLKNLVGRTSDVVYSLDGTPLHSSIFSYILKEITGRDGGVAKYKVYQMKKGQLEFEIVKGSTFTDETVRILRTAVDSQFGPGMETSIRFVDTIAREDSGKLRYFVSGVN